VSETEALTPGASGVEHHHRHRDVTGGWLRPGVFGAMDGTVTNVALIAGVAGGHATSHTVILTGIAGLLAGAFSMAVGEWTSVGSQNALIAREIENERQEIANRPAAEEAELAGMFRARGLSVELAREVASELSRDPDAALQLHVREELGVDMDAVAPPQTAAISSFIAFAVGALLPLLPYLAGARSFWWTAVIAGAALAALGAAVARFTARSPLAGAVRQLLLGAVTVAVVYAVGDLIGTGAS
jgi:VIT1/CCC1 family predicted Fe2+/Mn2+ transporter